MKLFYKLLLAAAFLSPLFSFAQGYYKQGFVINTKGDTVKGYIDLREWGNNPERINFKSSLDKSSQVFTVNDISYFEVPKVTAYKRVTTSVSLDETNIQRLQRARDTSRKMATIFLKEEQKGKNVILYSYQDDLKRRFYMFDNATNSLSELIYRIYFAADDNVNTVSQNQYKQQLLLTAQRFDTYTVNLKSLIEDADYNDADLVSICRKINNAKKEDIAKSNKKYIRFFVGAGASFNEVKRTDYAPLYTGNKSHSSVAPKISAGFNFYTVPEIGKSVFRLELAYTSVDFKSNGFPNYDDPTNKSIYSFEQHTISFTPQFLYNIYNTDPFKLYLDLGFSANFSTYSGNTLYNPVTDNTQKNYTGLNNRWLSIPLKAGVTLKNHLDVSLTYCYPQSITDNHSGEHQEADHALNLQNVQFEVGYIF